MLKQLLPLCWLSLAFHVEGAPQWNKYQKYLENPSVDRFREYLRIDTSKEENLKYAVEFWIRQATEAGIPYRIYKPAGMPIFVATLPGSDPSLPSIMLNSHMDVVKVDESQWSHPPFAADMDQNGDIFARGAQDTKDVGIQYMEAIRKIKQDNVTLLRTLHVTVMPDEETGGYKGMKAFVKTDEFKSLKIGFALDEGLSSLDNSLYATFVDRRPWQMRFVIYGKGGHGLAMPDGTAVENTYKFLSAVMKYRDEQKAIMRTKNSTDYSGYNAVNANQLNAGMMVNIIPSRTEVWVDMRLAPEADPAEIDALVKSWMREAGNRTELTFIRREVTSGITSVDDTNPYWVAMRRTLKSLGIKLRPIVLPATSDMLNIRNLGIPAIGFSPKTNTISRLHTENEYLNVDTFLKGIGYYAELVKALANVPDNTSNLLEYLTKPKCKV